MSIRSFAELATSFKPSVPNVTLSATSHHGRRVLVYGQLDEETRDVLLAEGTVLESAASPSDAIAILSWRTFDAIVVSPHEDDALSIAKALKLGDRVDGIAPLTVQLATMWHKRVPLFVMPFEGEHDYAIIVNPPTLAFLERTTRHPLAKLILRFEASKLFSSSNDPFGLA